MKQAPMTRGSHDDIISTTSKALLVVLASRIASGIGAFGFMHDGRPPCKASFRGLLPVFALTTVWMLVAMVVAVRQALN